MEGLGYSNIPTNQPWSSSTQSASQIVACNVQPWIPLISSCILENSVTGTVMPCRAPSWTGKGQTAILGNDQTPNTMNTAQIMGFNNVAPSITNMVWNIPNSNPLMNATIKDLGRLITVRQ